MIDVTTPPVKLLQLKPVSIDDADDDDDDAACSCSRVMGGANTDTNRSICFKLRIGLLDDFYE